MTLAMNPGIGITIYIYCLCNPFCVNVSTHRYVEETRQEEERAKVAAQQTGDIHPLSDQAENKIVTPAEAVEASGDDMEQ